MIINGDNFMNIEFLMNMLSNFTNSNKDAGNILNAFAGNSFNNGPNIAEMLKNITGNNFNDGSMKFFSALFTLMSAMNANKKPAALQQVNVNTSEKKFNIEKISGSDIALKIERYINAGK